MIKKIKNKNGSTYLQEVRTFRDENGKPRQENIRYIGKAYEFSSSNISDIFFCLDDKLMYICTKVLSNYIECIVYDINKSKRLEDISIQRDTKDKYYEGSVKLAFKIINQLIKK